jgi:hypothetical protein
VLRVGQFLKEFGALFWPLSLVAFLRADSNSRAVFAAATIEFIGMFNV